MAQPVHGEHHIGLFEDLMAVDDEGMEVEQKRILIVGGIPVPGLTLEKPGILWSDAQVRINGKLPGETGYPLQ